MSDDNGIYYYHHPESGCVFVSHNPPDIEMEGDLCVMEIDEEEYRRLKAYYDDCDVGGGC